MNKSGRRNRNRKTKNIPKIKLYELPLDVLMIIIEKLGLQDILNLTLTCKALRNLISKENSMWRAICRTRFIIHDKIKNYSESWYDRCRISRNWCDGRFQSEELITHHINYMPWLKYYDSTVILLTVGSELRCYAFDRTGMLTGRNMLWSVSMPKIQRHSKQNNDISRFAQRDKYIMCGNRNGSAAIYELANIIRKPHLIEYAKDLMLDGTHEVSAVDVCRKYTTLTVTGSTTYNAVFILGQNNKSLYFGVNGVKHLDGVHGIKCVAINESGDQVAVGPDGNSEPYVIDLNKLEFLLSSERFANKNEIVQDIQWHNQNTLCYVSHAGLVKMMDIRTSQVVYNAKDPFQAAFYCVKTDGHNAIVAGTSQHGRCVIYDTRKPFHTQLYFTRKLAKSSPVYSLDFNSTHIVAATDRGVAALDFRVPIWTPSYDYSHLYV